MRVVAPRPTNSATNGEEAQLPTNCSTIREVSAVCSKLATYIRPTRAEICDGTALAASNAHRIGSFENTRPLIAVVSAAEAASGNWIKRW